MPPESSHVRITALAACDGCAVVRVSGDLDYVSERQFLTSLGAAAAAGYRYLILDVTALSFCDSRGLYCMLSLRWLLHRRDGALLLAGVGRRLADLLHQTSSDTLLRAFDTVRQALDTVPEHHRPVWPPQVPCGLFETPEVRAELASSDLSERIPPPPAPPSGLA
ncbi:STAS domain-containing protein [Streptomyces daliensis]